MVSTLPLSIPEYMPSKCYVLILQELTNTLSFTVSTLTLAIPEYMSSKCYVMMLQEPTNTKTRLSGYGVELAIKSQEYKAKDDTKVEG